MKKLIFFIITGLAIFAALNLTGTKVEAKESISIVDDSDLNNPDTLYEADGTPVDLSKPNYSVMYGPTYITYKITSKKVTSHGYNKYRKGPSGRGPATLTMSKSSSVNTSFTSTISGDYPIGKGKIGASLGITIGATKTYGVTYSVKIPKKKKKQIIFRPRYKVYTVKQRTYANGQPTYKYKTAKVKAFENWDYDWKYIK